LRLPRKKNISTYTLLTSTDVLVENLRTLNRDEIESTLLGYGRCEQRLAASRVPIKEKPEKGSKGE